MEYLAGCCGEAFFFLLIYIYIYIYAKPMIYEIIWYILLKHSRNAGYKIASFKLIKHKVLYFLVKRLREICKIFGETWVTMQNFIKGQINQSPKFWGATRAESWRQQQQQQQGRIYPKRSPRGKWLIDFNGMSTGPGLYNT